MPMKSIIKSALGDAGEERKGEKQKNDIVNNTVETFRGVLNAVHTDSGQYGVEIKYFPMADYKNLGREINLFIKSYPVTVGDITRAVDKAFHTMDGFIEEINKVSLLHNRKNGLCHKIDQGMTTIHIGYVPKDITVYMDLITEDDDLASPWSPAFGRYAYELLRSFGVKPHGTTPGVKGGRRSIELLSTLEKSGSKMIFSMGFDVPTVEAGVAKHLRTGSADENQSITSSELQRLKVMDAKELLKIKPQKKEKETEEQQSKGMRSIIKAALGDIGDDKQ